jgi:hypothetical protein
MAFYIPLNKIPNSPKERKELLEKKIALEEAILNDGLNFIQKKILDFLIDQKGYLKEDIETNVNFKVELPETSFDVVADIILKINGRRCGVIKCAMNSMESWERYTIALCRVIELYKIPFAIVTDGENAKILDSFNGVLISEGLDSLLTRMDLERLIKEIDFLPYPPEKSEKEKRILYAFDAIRCPTSV